RITDDRAEVDRLLRQVMERFRRPEAEARDLMLVGSVAEIQDKLGRLRDVGVDVVFVPSVFLPEDPRPLLDRFSAEVAPALRGARGCPRWRSRTASPTSDPQEVEVAALGGLEHALREQPAVAAGYQARRRLPAGAAAGQLGLGHDQVEAP